MDSGVEDGGMGEDMSSLLDLGLALGHTRFEVVSLGTAPTHGRAGRGFGGGTQLWADVGHEDVWEEKSLLKSSTRRVANELLPKGSSRKIDPRVDEEMKRLHQRVEDLELELTSARRDCARLIDQLKREEELGRKQQKRAHAAMVDASTMREELKNMEDKHRVEMAGASKSATLFVDRDDSVRVRERCRHQQAESLMQAYKGLYEEQCRSEKTASQCYRNLVRSYSRMSVENRRLRFQLEGVQITPAFQRGEGVNKCMVAPEKVDAVLEGVVGTDGAVRPITDGWGSKNTDGLGRGEQGLPTHIDVLDFDSVDHMGANRVVCRNGGVGCKRERVEVGGKGQEISSCTSPAESNTTVETDGSLALVNRRGPAGGEEGSAGAEKAEQEVGGMSLVSGERVGCLSNPLGPAREMPCLGVYARTHGDEKAFPPTTTRPSSVSVSTTSVAVFSEMVPTFSESNDNAMAQIDRSQGQGASPTTSQSTPGNQGHECAGKDLCQLGLLMQQSISSLPEWVSQTGEEFPLSGPKRSSSPSYAPTRGIGIAWGGGRRAGRQVQIGPSNSPNSI